MSIVRESLHAELQVSSQKKKKKKNTTTNQTTKQTNKQKKKKKQQMNLHLALTLFDKIEKKFFHEKLKNEWPKNNGFFLKFPTIA